MPRMFNPAYPGLTLCDDVLPALGPNVTEAVTKLDDSAALLVALRHVASAHGMAEVARRGLTPEHA